MIAGRITDATRVLGAPRDWDEKRHGPCGGLPIRDQLTTAGQGMTSAWLPTPDEIELIDAGAPVHLTVLGEVHPPVAMDVGSAPDASVDQLQLPIPHRNSA